MLEPALAIDRGLLFDPLLLELLLARLTLGVGLAGDLLFLLLFLFLFGRALCFDDRLLARALRLFALEPGDFFLCLFRALAVL